MAVAVGVEGFADFSPCPRVVLTITGLGTSESVVSVWRVAEGGRASVRGARRLRLTDSGFVTDFDVPLARPVSYEVEVVSGEIPGDRVQSAVVVVDPGEGCLSDPLMPQSSVPVTGRGMDREDVYLRASAFGDVSLQAEVQTFSIMGSSVPFALFGQRMAASGLDTSVGVRSAERNRKLLDLLGTTASLLFRPHPSWGVELPGVMFLANANAVMQPVTTPFGGDLTWWSLKSDVVSAPTLKPLSGGLSFGDVQMLYSTFEAKHVSVVAAASAAGEQPTFLFDLMHPLG